MTVYLKRNLQFMLMILVWVIAGNISEMLATGLVIVSVILLKRKQMIPELVSGFIIILVLSDSWEPSLAFAKEAKTIYLLLLTAFMLLDSKNFRITNHFFLPFVPFLGWALIQFVRSPEMIVSFQKTLSYGLLFMVLPGYFFRLFKDHGTSFLRNHVFLMCLVLIAGLILWVVVPEKAETAGRFMGLMGNPNGMGLLCLTLFMLVQIVFSKFPHLFSKQERFFIYLLIAVSVLFSGSRNTIISIGLFLMFTRLHKLSPYIGFTLLIVIAISYQYIFDALPGIIEATGLSGVMRIETLETGSGRLVAWGFAWQLINESFMMFFCGNGFGYDEYIFIKNKLLLSSLGHIGGVHNTYLALWLNTGLIGLILWSYAFIKLFLRAVPLSHMTMPILYTVVFSASFEAWLMGSLNPYTITFLLTLSLIITPSGEMRGENGSASDMNSVMPGGDEENIIPAQTS